jgi:hypothetical protein
MPVLRQRGWAQSQLRLDFRGTVTAVGAAWCRTLTQLRDEFNGTHPELVVFFNSSSTPPLQYFQCGLPKPPHFEAAHPSTSIRFELDCHSSSTLL